MTSIIKFTSVFNVLKEYYPKPANSFIPDWYKNLNSYTTDDKRPIKGKPGETPATIKRCMPVFDSITSGYIIPTYVDLWIRQEPDEQGLDTETQPFYQWANYDAIKFHPTEQAPNYPQRKNHKYFYPKWANPWSIKTPPGYSCLFVPPFHRESVFSIIPGIVDTDKYDAPVNFPFVLNDADKFEGLIPAGVPMVQVIPFQRGKWEMTIGDETDFKNSMTTLNHVRIKFFDAYKQLFRQHKEYK